MIQRIQSVYLLLAALCHIILFFTAIATFTGVDAQFNLSIFGFHQLTREGSAMLFNTYALMTINILIVLLTIYVIFSYKNRGKQMKLGGFNLLLICGFVVLMFFDLDNAKMKIAEKAIAGNLDTTFGIGMILPIVAVIFNFLALRAIRKDDELVRSADRIR